MRWLLLFRRCKVDTVLLVLIVLSVVTNICLFVSQVVELGSNKNKQGKEESSTRQRQEGQRRRRRRRRRRGSRRHSSRDPSVVLEDAQVNNFLLAPLKGPGYATTGGELPSDPNRVHPNPATWNALDNDTCLHKQQDAQPVYAWQRKVPYAIVLGAMKAGTQALMYYLTQHPNVSRGIATETHFFNSPEWFTSTPQGISQVVNQKAYATKMQQLHPDLFTSTASSTATTTIKPHLIALDSTPYYLLASDRIPNYITCVAPWAKLIAIVRNPVERAASHYRYLAQARQRNQKPMVDWERWVQHDLHLLQKAGVVPHDWNNTATLPSDQNLETTISGSTQEFEAWKHYVRNYNSQHLLGRGLYAIQLEHYFQALERAGRPRSDLLVLRSEDLRNDTQRVYDKLLDFLNLPPHTLRNVQLQHETTNVGVPMPNHVRTLLESFFEPFNQRLFRLLQWSNVDNDLWPRTTSSA